MHDRRGDADFVEQSIRNISDGELLRSLDVLRPALQDIRAAAERDEPHAAYAAWAKYWPGAPDRIHFVGESGFILPLEQATASLEADRDKVLRDADSVLRHHIRGWGQTVIQHGPVVDFNAGYGAFGKYGFHYWDFAACLLQAFC